jgi:hypothetical protein
MPHRNGVNLFLKEYHLHLDVFVNTINNRRTPSECTQTRFFKQSAVMEEEGVDIPENSYNKGGECHIEVWKGKLVQQIF